MHSDLPTSDFSRRLQQMGVAQPNPTFSPSSTANSSLDPADTGFHHPPGPVFASSKQNTTLSVLDARRCLQQRAEEDFEAMGRASSTGRQFIDMRTMIDALQLLDRGLSRAQVEKQLKLRPSVLNQLGRSGIITHVSSDRVVVSN